MKNRRVKIKESTIQAVVLSYLSFRPEVFCWRNQNVGVWDPVKRIHRKNSTVKGISDILGITNTGRLIALEVKSDQGRVSKDQQNFLDKIRAMGGIAGVVRNAEDAAKILDDALAV